MEQTNNWQVRTRNGHLWVDVPSDALQMLANGVVDPEDRIFHRHRNTWISLRELERVLVEDAKLAQVEAEEKRSSRRAALLLILVIAISAALLPGIWRQVIEVYGAVFVWFLHLKIVWRMAGMVLLVVAFSTVVSIGNLLTRRRRRRQIRPAV